MQKFIFGSLAVLFSASAASANTYYNPGNVGQYNQGGFIGQGNASQQYQPRGGGYQGNYQGGGYQGGGYQPQQNQQFRPYGQGAPGAYGQQNRGYGYGQQGQQSRGQKPQASKAFEFDVFAGYEGADFGFNMNSAGSEISFNNITWQKIGAAGKGTFDLGGTAVEIKGGLELGTQGKSGTVTDDDMQNGGIWSGFVYFSNGAQDPSLLNWSSLGGDNEWVNFGSTELAYGVGEQGKGSSLGFFASVGLANGWTLADNITLKPSVGYRYESYKLIGQNVITTSVLAILGEGYDEQGVPYMMGDLQAVADFCGNASNACDVMVVFDKDDIPHFVGFVMGLDDYDEPWFLTLASAHALDGITHKYDVVWAGPFIAADIEAKLMPKMTANMRIEIGFPGYSSEADQPFRSDLAHPVAFRDSAGMFSGMHYGLMLGYTAAITDGMSVGLDWKWDYYEVKGAASESFYARGYPAYEEHGPSFKIDNEVNARYKQSGLRATLKMKF
ncbi:MAG: hypothetical protein LBB23_03405 [Rickettsiales bacterium]|jgi:hypothetical protein|nr:hypothetical protein [Rickettsiales bacterium]